jgi:hypothetical protein
VVVYEHMASTRFGPNLVRVSEQMLAVFVRAGFPAVEAGRAFGAISSYVTGVAMGEAALRLRLERRNETEVEWAAAKAQSVEEAGGEAPLLLGASAAYSDMNLQQAASEDFDYGLDLMLDGLQTQLANMSRS